MTQKSEQKFLSRLSSTLDDSLTDIDDDVLSRLRHARMQAVEIADNSNEQECKPVFATVFPSWLAPVSSVATFATVALVAISLWLNQPNLLDNNDLNSVKDMTILSSNDELEFYQNLDFYLWLAQYESTS